jgi:poly(3-hydroxybutyrate) depolymerase
MKTNKMLKSIGSAALAALVIHPLATPLHAGVVNIGQNFTGTTSSINASPGPNGAASADYVVELNRSGFTVYAKANGSVVQSTNDVAFWTAAGVPLYASTCGTDCRVVYDPTVQRWFAVEVLGNCALSWATARLRLAVSATADPTGAWHGVTLPDNPGATNDFSDPYLGLDAQGVYISAVVWPTNTSANVPAGTALWSWPKTDLLAIPPVITNRTWFGVLSPTNSGYGLNPAICFDGSAGGDMLATGSTGMDPITGNPVTNNTLVGSAIQNASGPGPATLSGPQSLLVPPYTEPINYALQPDGANLVDWDAEFSSSIYCVGGVLFAAHALQDGPHIAIRWYRINAADNSLLESGTLSDPNLDLYFPSIAANTNGTVVLAFNGSGSNAFVSCYAMVGWTVNGVTTFGNRLLLRPGVANYNPDPSGDSPWGSFSTLCVDPTDPNVFWTLNACPAGPTNWSTQITQLLTSLRAQTNPPVFTMMPGSQTALVGDAATFWATVNPSSPVQYQWRFNGNALPGETNSVLTLLNVQPSDEGDYDLVATNSSGMAASLPARLNVMPDLTNLVARVFTNGATLPLPYRLFIPSNYDATLSYPLVMFLHGSGSIGTDNLSQLVDQPEPLVFVSYGHQVTAPAFFVAPQLNPAYGNWSEIEPQLIALLAALSQEFPVDTNRLYITGLSLGGIGTWGLLADYPRLFAAAVPMSGSGNPGAASIFKDVPVWDFHSLTDDTVSVSGSEDMIQALRAVGGTPIYTEYATGGHAIWLQAYSTPGLVEWTMAQSRLAPGTADPRITITAPTTNAFYATHASSLSLAGTASAGGAGILSVHLANLIGVGSTSVKGTNTWSATSTLVSGKTNLLQFIATTTSWAPDFGGSTTFAQDFTVAANIPLTLSMTAQSQSLTLQWSGGIPPYSVQTTDDLTAGNWADLLTNAISPFSIPIQPGQAFFRIQGQ